jgi:enediyne biosynthesis protein E4
VSGLQAATGAKRILFTEREKMMNFFPRQHVPKAAFRNNRDLTFTDVGSEWGLNDRDIAHGFCAADLDNDGDLDLVMNNLGTAAAIYRNDSTAPRITVRLQGAGKNTSGVGARIRVRRNGSFVQSQEIIAGGRYLSGDAMERVFADPEGGAVSVEVQWRNGTKQTIERVAPNSRCVITQKGGG